MNMIFEGEYGAHLRRGLIAVLVLLVLFLAVETLAGIRGLRYIGAGLPPSNVITITGEGEVFMVPDLALFTYSVVVKEATVAAAQTEATAKTNAALAYLEEEGVGEKDIKTTSYSVYPQYEWQEIRCLAYPCPPGKQVLTGYEVRQSIQVKVRDTGKAGDLLSGVGEKGATEVSGLTFTVDDEEEIRKEARAEAIADAKRKAHELERSLGVRLGRIVSYNEYDNGGGIPPYYGYGRGGDVAIGLAESKAPELPSGENTFTSQITITYEIR